MGPMWNSGLAYLSGAMTAVDGMARSLGSKSLMLSYAMTEDELARPADIAAMAKSIRLDTMKGGSRMQTWLAKAPAASPQSLAVFIGTWPDGSLPMDGLNKLLSQRNGWNAPGIAVLRFTPDLPQGDRQTALTSLYILLLGEHSVVRDCAKRLNGVSSSSWPRKEAQGMDIALILPRPFDDQVPIVSWKRQSGGRGEFANGDFRIQTGAAGPLVSSTKNHEAPQFAFRISGEPAEPKGNALNAIRDAAAFFHLDASWSVEVSNVRAEASMDPKQVAWRVVRSGSNEGLATVVADSVNGRTAFMKPQKDIVEANRVVLDMSVNRERIKSLQSDAKVAQVKVRLTGRATDIVFPTWVKDQTGERTNSRKIGQASVSLTPFLSEKMLSLVQALAESWKERAKQGFADASVAEVTVLVNLTNK